MSPQFRVAESSDAEACIHLRAITRENAISAEQLAEIGITSGRWAIGIASGETPGFVCVVSGSLVGYCFGSTSTGEVLVLALHPEYENRGIGRELLHLVTTLLFERGHKRLFLGCASDPALRSHGFYRHLGWHSTGTFDSNDDEILEYLQYPLANGVA